MCLRKWKVQKEEKKPTAKTGFFSCCCPHALHAKVSLFMGKTSFYLSQFLSWKFSHTGGDFYKRVTCKDGGKTTENLPLELLGEKFWPKDLRLFLALAMQKKPLSLSLSAVSFGGRSGGGKPGEGGEEPPTENCAPDKSQLTRQLSNRGRGTHTHPRPHLFTSHIFTRRARAHAKSHMSLYFLQSRTINCCARCWFHSLFVCFVVFSLCMLLLFPFFLMFVLQFLVFFSPNLPPGTRTHTHATLCVSMHFMSVSRLRTTVSHTLLRLTQQQQQQTNQKRYRLASRCLSSPSSHSLCS